MKAFSSGRGGRAGSGSPGWAERAGLHWLASGWKGTSRVQVCEPPRRLLRTLSRRTTPTEWSSGAHGRGGRTVLVVGDRRVPLDQIAGYGAPSAWPTHLAGGDRCDAAARWQELLPVYRDLASGERHSQAPTRVTPRGARQAAGAGRCLGRGAA